MNNQTISNNGPIKIQVVFYAHLKTAAGTDATEVELPAQATVADLKTVLKHRFPALGYQLVNTVTFINKQTLYLDNETLPDGAMVTFLPPMAGG
jgi:molybdopterin converting factor small subunit